MFFIGNIIKAIMNLLALISALVMLSSLGEMTMDMARHAAKESKSGFLSISKLNAQLSSDPR